MKAARRPESGDLVSIERAYLRDASGRWLGAFIGEGTALVLTTDVVSVVRADLQLRDVHLLHIAIFSNELRRVAHVYSCDIVEILS